MLLPCREYYVLVDGKPQNAFHSVLRDSNGNRHDAASNARDTPSEIDKARFVTPPGVSELAGEDAI